MSILNQPKFNNTAYSTLLPNIITTNISSYAVIASYNIAFKNLQNVTLITF